MAFHFSWLAAKRAQPSWPAFPLTCVTVAAGKEEASCSPPLSLLERHGGWHFSPTPVKANAKLSLAAVPRGFPAAGVVAGGCLFPAGS